MLQLILFKCPLIVPGMRVLHLAPEIGISKNIRAVVGSGYEAYDLVPKNLQGLDVRRMDLVTDAELLPGDHYDVVIHSHVLEHLPCDVTSVLFHLHRSLRSTGVQVFSIPIRAGYYEADLRDLPAEQRVKRFGQEDHMRMFGARDMARTLGMVFKLPAEYDLEAQFSSDLLDRFNIPKHVRMGYNSSSVFVIKKDEIKLR